MLKANELATTLAAIPWLAVLDPPTRIKLAEQFQEQSYSKGRSLFLQGDPGDALYLLTEGQLRIAVENPDGKNVTVAVRGPGSFVGDQALLDGQARSASAYAAPDCRCLILYRRQFDHLLAEHPSAARALLVFLSLRLREATAQLENLATRTIRQRLAATLAQTAAQSAEKQPDGYLLPANVNYEFLVGVLCTSREPISRAARDLIDEGLITRVSRRFKVLDLAGLQAVSGILLE